ncbi:MAG: hypothetical protein APF76_09170 [Desulfitibacter sp. BRH_c19]|nr:MAG: hypothetical protein APF76_09170 [Desulfitibacter sp. BRH_c19]
MNKSIISFTIVLLVLGIFISMQFKTQQQLINSLAYQDARDLITLYNTMKEKQDDLSITVQELRQRKSTIEYETARGIERIDNTEQEIEQLQMLNGELPVNGPGITVTITGDAPLLHYDLVDLVNELWATGAEAIAINDHRITVNTYIQPYSSDEIFVNDEKLLFPCIIKAIGDPHTLEKGLTFTGGLVENWSILYGIYPSITPRDNIAIPAVKNRGVALE